MVQSAGLGGPFIWFVWLVLAASLAVSIDVLRRPRVHFGRLGKLPWLVVQLAHLGVALAVAFGGPGTEFVHVVSALFVIAFVQQIAYLLRVVFPSPERHAERLAATATPRFAEGGDDATTTEEPSGGRRVPAPAEITRVTPEE